VDIYAAIRHLEEKRIQRQYGQVAGPAAKAYGRINKRYTQKEKQELPVLHGAEITLLLLNVHACS
jgi:hypothetical protein